MAAALETMATATRPGTALEFQRISSDFSHPLAVHTLFTGKLSRYLQLYIVILL